MRNILKNFLRLVTILVMLFSSAAHAQFQSLHQFGVTHNIGSSLDALGNLYFTKTPQLFGFKDQFAPSGVSGCVMGYPELRALCQTVDGGFSFTFEGYSSYTEFKVYVPAGTTFFGLAGYMPQSVEYAAAVRFGSAPTRMGTLSPTEYANAKTAQNRNTDFAKLLAGEERLMVHDGGGSISLSGIARLSTSPLTTGQWLYVRVLNGSSIAGLGAIYEVNLDKYREGYNATTFGANGDPDAGGSIPDNPGTNPGTGTALTGISLSKSEYTLGGSINNFSIYPVPSTAALPACTFSPSGVLAYNSILPPSTAIANVSINTTAAEQLTQAQTSFTITCGNQTAIFKIKKTGTDATATIEEVIGTNGNVTLKLKITRPAAQVTPTAKASYWVGAVIPGSALFSQEDEWFYLSTGSTVGNYEWKQLVVPYPITVAFAKNSAVTATNEELTIPLGFTREEFKAFGIRVHFGYQLNDGLFQQFDYVWNPRQ